MPVVDSSAVLALLKGEQGSELAATLIKGAKLSAVNLQEVLQRLIDDKTPASEAQEVVEALKLDVRSHDEAGAKIAASLRPLTRHLGLSLGDRSCLALAISLGEPAYTADRVWKRLDIEGLEIVLIR